MTVFEGIPGKAYEVTALELAEDITRRLEALGIFEGTIVKVFAKKRDGAVIIKARGAKWALGKPFAKGICVKELST